MSGTSGIQSTPPLTAAPRSSTSDPLRGIVDLTSAIGNGIRQGENDAAAIEKNLGLAPATAPATPPPDNSRNVVFLVVGALVLVGVVAVVLYVVRRGHK